MVMEDHQSRQIQEKTKEETSGRTTRDIINVEFLAHVLCDLVCDLEARFAEFESHLHVGARESVVRVEGEHAV